MDNILHRCPLGPTCSNQNLMEANDTTLRWIQQWHDKIWWSSHIRPPVRALMPELGDCYLCLKHPVFLPNETMSLWLSLTLSNVWMCTSNATVFSVRKLTNILYISQIKLLLMTEEEWINILHSRLWTSWIFAMLNVPWVEALLRSFRQIWHGSPPLGVLGDKTKSVRKWKCGRRWKWKYNKWKQ